MKSWWHKCSLAMSLLLIASSASAMWGASTGSTAEQTSLRSQSLDVSHAGSEVTRRLFVTEDRSYTFAMRLKFRDGDTAGDREASDQLRRLLRDTRASKDSNHLKQGIAIPLRLKISVAEAAGERIVIDRELDQQQLDNVQSDAVWARIGRVDLPPGFYRLSIQSRSDLADLSRIPASVEISWAKRTEPVSHNSAEMAALLTKIQNIDLLNHLSGLERVPLGTSDKFFLRAESFAIPDAVGVLDPCSHRLHLHRESGSFWIVRRCSGSGVAIFRGVQPGLAVAPGAAQILAFKRH